MQRSFLAVTGIVCLLAGVLQRGGWGQDTAALSKRDWSRRVIIAQIAVPDTRSRALTRFSFLPAPRPFAARSVRPATPDAWNAASGNWSVGGNWTAGIPTGSSAVTIGNTSSVVVTEDQASAAAASLAITNDNELYIAPANTLTVGGATTVSANSQLQVGTGGAGGSVLNSGAFTNGGYVQVGYSGMSLPSTLNVTGSFTNTGGRLLVSGGSASGSNGLLEISGAAPTTLTGLYQMEANVGSAAVQWGSGGITQIGDGSTNSGYVYLAGSNAYLETGATNSNSALKSLATIAGNGELQMDFGASVTTTGALTNDSGGQLYVGDFGAGGASLTAGGSLTNNGTMQIGNGGMTSTATTKVTGVFSDTGGRILIAGGNASGSNALLNVTGAAPGTLTGTYQVEGSVGSAAAEWGSGAITQIGDGGSNYGDVYLAGSNAYLEVGATNSNSALKTLATIAGNGELEMDYGATLTTTGALTVNSGGQLYVGDFGPGGATLNVGGNLTNAGNMQVGNGGLGVAETLSVAGTLNDTGGRLTVAGGNVGGSNALVNVSGAAPGTLTGVYQMEGSTGSAAIEWGSGAITQIGDGVSNSSIVYLAGTNAYMEVGATNSNSALKTLNTIASNGELELDYGATVTTTGALSVKSGGQLYVGDFGPGGATLNLGGALTSAGNMQVGNSGISAPATVNVTGTFTDTGGRLTVAGGNASGGNALLKVSGAAPGTLTGVYQVEGNVGSAAVEWGSGGITQIGDGATNSSIVYLAGNDAYMEVGATNSNSALKGLTTVASNGELELDYAATLNTTGALAVNSSGQLYVGDFGPGGATLSLGGALTNAGYAQVGNAGLQAAATVDVTGTFTNTGGRLTVNGGNAVGGNALLKISGAAPSTLTGTYQVEGNTGSAAVEWGSGGIKQIGDGATNSGSVYLAGTNAYMETGATNSESALKGLTTIASNGELELDYAAALTTTGALTNSGLLFVGDFGPGGGTLNVGKALTNKGTVQVGSAGLGAAATLLAGTSFTNASTGTVNIYGGNVTTGNAILEVTGPTMTNAGNIYLNGSSGDAGLEINGNVALSGAGKISMSNIATNIITGASTSDTLTNSSTIQGSGTIDSMGIVNKGTILANQSTPLLILPSSLGLNNQGTLSVLTGDTMQIGTAAGGALTNLSGTTLTGGTYSVGGTMQFGASDASIVTDAASISLTGAGAQMINFGGANLLTNLATITSAGSLTLGASWGTFTTAGNFTNNGTLTVGSADKFIVNLADSLTNFSGTTLTGGTYKITGTLEFNGANIVTNDASITLTGAGSKIDGKNGANGLANFAVNGAGASFTLGKGRSFTTAGNFTNNGLLTVGAGDTFDVNGSLANFSGSTLTGGNYNVSGILQFNGANIVTNAATITLGSTTAKIQNQSAANAMLGFNTNTAAGKFTLSGNANLTTTGGSFTNAGSVTVSTGSTFSIGGSSFNYTQTAGTTTVDGILTSTNTGAVDVNGGNLYGTGSLNDAVLDAATLTPGNSATSTGKLQVNGTYAQNSAGAFDVTIGGLTAGTQFDQLNVSSTASLNGTLNITLASGYTPHVGNTFDILNASTVSGNFTTINGLSINGSEHFTVTTVNGDEIVLTVVSGAASSNSVSLTELQNSGRVHPSRYGLGILAGHHMLAPVFTPSLARIPAASLARIPPSPRMPFAPQAGLTAGRHSLRPMDEFGSTIAASAAPGAGETGLPGWPGLTPVSAAAYNGMAAMNHMRFECGVDLGALMKTSPKRLLKALWASPDSPDALSIGYMNFTAR